MNIMHLFILINILILFTFINPSSYQNFIFSSLQNLERELAPVEEKFNRVNLLADSYVTLTARSY